MIKSAIKDAKVWLHLMAYRDKWRKMNPHNKTVLGKYFFDLSRVTVGNGTYGSLNITMFSGDSRVIIGDFCSIASDVEFVVSGEHNLKTLSTYPFKAQTLGLGSEAGSKGDIIVEDDVWFGINSTIMSGVRIGKGSVIAAGALVTKDVPEYSIVCGVPARVIGKRFSEDIINKLHEFSFKNLTKDYIASHIDQLYEEINDNNIDEILTSLNTDSYSKRQK